MNDSTHVKGRRASLRVHRRLYDQAVKRGDIRTALAALDAEARLLGLDEPPRTTLHLGSMLLDLLSKATFEVRIGKLTADIELSLRDSELSSDGN